MEKTDVIYFREQNGPIDLSLKSVTDNRIKKRETKHFRNASNLRENEFASVQNPSSTKWPKIASYNGSTSAVLSCPAQPQEFRRQLFAEDSNTEDIQKQVSQTPFNLPSLNVPFVSVALGIRYPTSNFLPVETSFRNRFQKLSSVENDKSLESNRDDECIKTQEGNAYSCYPERQVVQQCDSRSSSRNSKSDSNTFSDVFRLPNNVPALRAPFSLLQHSSRVNGENSCSAELSQIFPNRCEHRDIFEEEQLPKDLSINNSHHRLEEFASIALKSEKLRTFTRLRRSASLCSVSNSSLKEDQCHARSRSKSDSETPGSSPTLKAHSYLWAEHSLRDEYLNRNLMGSHSCSRFPENKHSLSRKDSQMNSNSSCSPKPLVRTVAKHSMSLKNRENNRYCDPFLVNTSDFFTLEAVDASSLAASNDKNTLLMKLRQITPSGYPWSVYGYYTYLMQMYHNHQAGTPAEVRSISNSSLPSTCPPQFFAAGSPKYDNLPVEENVNGVEKKHNRTLTGKHVKYGTGASPSTLFTLRQKIQERQKAKDLTETSEVLSSGRVVEAGKKTKPKSLVKMATKKKTKVS